MTTAAEPIAQRGSARPPAQTFGAETSLDDASTRLRRYRLGFALYFCSVVMIFAGFSSAYIVRRGIPVFDAAVGGYSASWEPLRIPIFLLLLNTICLCAASATMELARRRSHRLVRFETADRRWIVLSLALCLVFVAGQAVAWRILTAGGQVLTSGARTAFFYVLTGTHAVHAILGIAALAWITIQSTASTRSRHLIAVDLTAWYLHGMTLLWIYLFLFLLFA